MSSLTNTVPFSLDEINLRKKLVFPDGTIQSTAYTGAVAGATLNEVLFDGNDANYQGIDNLLDLVITDAGGVNKSRIEQAGVNLQIDCGNLTSSVSSTILFYTTDAVGSSVQQMEIADAGVSIVPPVSLTSTTAPISSATQPLYNDNSNKMPTTSWVQSAIQQRTAFLDLISTNTTISIVNSYVGITPVTILTVPNLPAKGQYLLSFSLQLEFPSGNPQNMICRENVTSAIPGQIATVTVRPYQYPSTTSVFSAYGTGVYVSGTYILNTLVVEATGLIFDLECGWTNGGDVDCVAQSLQISYLGSSTGAV